MLDQLEGRQRAAELAAFDGVVPGDVEGRELLAHRLPGHAEPGDLEELVGVAEAVGVGELKRSGTTTLSRMMSAFCTVRSEILFSIFVAL